MSDSDFTGPMFVSTQRHDTYPAIEPSKADLSGKVVLITGASKGIGKAAAVAFAQAGVRGLVLLARSDLTSAKEAALSHKRPGQPLEVLTIPVDVTDNAQVVSAIEQIEKTIGHLDVVINNAGYIEATKFVADSDPEDWWTTWNVNMRGTYHVSRAALPFLLKCGGDKTIINVSSAASTIFVPGSSAYGTTKLALLRFSEWIHVEYGSKDVLAYSIHPGALKTDLTSDVPQEYQYLFCDTLELPAHSLVWLVKERRKWLAGRYLNCVWDVEEVLAKKDEIIQGDKLKFKLVV